MQTGEYVGHENDLWNFRAPFTGTQYLYPGEARSVIGDEAVELDLTAEEPAPESTSDKDSVRNDTIINDDFDPTDMGMDIEHDINDDFLENLSGRIPTAFDKSTSERRSTRPAEEIDPLDKMLAKFGYTAGSWTEPDPEDPEFLENLRTMSMMKPGMPRFVGDLESGFEIIDGDWGLLCGNGVDRDAGKTAEERSRDHKETETRIRSEIKNKMPPLLDMNDNTAKLLFDPSTHFDHNPPKIRPKVQIKFLKRVWVGYEV